MSTTYPSTVSTWPGAGVVQIFDVSGTRIALLSVSFLHKGGVLSWDYIDSAIASVVVESGELGKISDIDGALVERPSVPTAGSYRFLRLDDSLNTPTLRRGPLFQYKSKGPPPSGQHSDTMSNSSRRSANQDNFRFQLAVRDGFCLVTDKKKAVASHILPISRPEYYAEVLGYDPGYLYDVSYGLFLSRDLHYAFDRGEWGLYPKPGEPETWLVHIFYSEDPTDELKQYHGKEIPRSRFRHHSVEELPNAQLMAFHYRQCVIKHVRLTSFFPETSTSV